MKAIELTSLEAKSLLNHLNDVVGKGSQSTTPAWARKIIGKIKEQDPDNDAGYKEVVCINKKTGKKAKMGLCSIIGDIIYLKDFPSDEPLKNHRDKVIYSDEPEFLDWEIIK